ncbi:hypothetical protein LINPERHAP2_LOCUS18675 [Linum perenne]
MKLGNHIVLYSPVLFYSSISQPIQLSLDCCFVDIAESKQVSSPVTAGQKYETEAFEYIDNNLESIGLMAGDDTLKENQKGLLDLLHDSKVKEEDYADQVVYQTIDDEVATKDDDDSDDLTDNDDVELRRFVEPLPPILAHELTVCYEENLEHVVKDICVDEGLPLHDSFLFDTSMDDEEYLSTYLSPGKAENGSEVVKDSAVEVIIPGPDVPNSSDEGSENAEVHCEEVENGRAENSSSNSLEKSLSLRDSPLLPEPGTDRSCHSPLSDQTSGIHQQVSPLVSFMFISANRNPNAKWPDEDHENDSKLTCSQDSLPNAVNREEEITSERHSLDSLPDELIHEVVSRLSFDTEVENAAIITFQSDSTASTSARKDMFLPNDDPMQELKTLISSKIGSELIPHPGSISMRSDSSTTSTRSFAFPVLQNEWNSSPVRMAKADRRLLRKHRRWKQRILCCKF